MLPNNDYNYYVFRKENGNPVCLFEANSLIDIYRKFRTIAWYHLPVFAEDLDAKVPDRQTYWWSGKLHELIMVVGACVIYDKNERVVRLQDYYNAVDGWFRSFPVRQWRDRGQRARAYGHWRSPKTFQEKKAYYATTDWEEVNIKVRGKRKPHNLVDTWDDLHSHNEKCWKRHRRTQWKAK